MAAVCVGALFALGGAGAARAERLPFQADVDICARRAVDLGDSSLSGSVRLELLSRADGKVYAAFAHSGKGVKDKVFDYCLASNALLWQYPAASVDTSGPFPITVTPGSATATGHSRQTPPNVFLPSARPEIEPADLDVARAQASLNVLDDATPAERGQALMAVHKYPEAIALFRTAIEKSESDRLALRGLAQALAESGGDLVEAQATAMKLIAIAPASVVGFEALLRVCAVAKDDECVFRAWQHARTATDMEPRSRILKEDLQPLVENAAARLKVAAQERASHPAEASDAGAPVAADPCATEADPEKQALCVVKRCLDAGSALYAQEISKDGLKFEAGAWSFKTAGKDRLLVTRKISSPAKEGGAVEHRDAIFLVKMGDKFSIQPSSADARVIAREHNSCAPQAAAAPAPANAGDAGTPASAPAAPAPK